ncbi:hypothetical protein KDW_14790 [Dictyobacter vulcani]|uniref:Uncharacterized protein n=1 Tax=Dictyobacter vulcani TaxID=2607529 RepID=A0A5J4KLM4_9CHLR|nr:hypothetical protein [Dictyobacter vulcani]GER87317.1 hypothetical protein KDW_14790 [Dictyobacter vulcani]
MMGTNSLEQLACHIHTLQTLQMLVPKRARSATLASTASLVSTLCQEFGAAATLEEVIQALVGRHLRAQMRTRTVAG